MTWHGGSAYLENRVLCKYRITARSRERAICTNSMGHSFQIHAASGAVFVEAPTEMGRVPLVAS